MYALLLFFYKWYQLIRIIVHVHLITTIWSYVVERSIYTYMVKHRMGTEDNSWEAVSTELSQAKGLPPLKVLVVSLYLALRCSWLERRHSLSSSHPHTSVVICIYIIIEMFCYDDCSINNGCETKDWFKCVFFGCENLTNLISLISVRKSSCSECKGISPYDIIFLPSDYISYFQVTLCRW